MAIKAPVNAKYQLTTNKNYRPGWQLSDLLRVPEVERQQQQQGSSENKVSRGFFTDIALGVTNRLSRQRYNRKFRRTRKRHPEYPVILAAGDSWFNHPLYKTAIDFLSEMEFAIRNIAMAGHNLYVTIEKGDVFKFLEKDRPDFLLLSGSHQLFERDSEKDEIEIRQDAAQSATDFDQIIANTGIEYEINRLVKTHQSLFEQILDRSKEIQIIFHGFDYLIPDEENGLFLSNVDHGIEDPVVLQKLGNYIIDLLNDQMQELASKFKNVHYLDLRNTVKQDQWHDEMHPDEQAAVNIMQKFLEKINALQTFV